MQISRTLAALGLLATAAVANADVVDYAHEGGWYIGAWGSNIDWLPKASTEVDLYTGFKGKVGEFGWDAGIVYYSYPSDSDVNTAEIYGKFSYSVVTGSVYYTNDYYNSDEHEIYLSADAAIPLGPVSLTLHAGYTDSDAIPDGDYKDYAAGISYSADNITLGFKYIITDGLDRFGAGPDTSDDRVVLSISTTLPWAK